MRAPHPEPRVRLTAGDGTGLKLTSLTAHAVVQQPLALTELRMAFQNPSDRTLEGTFRFTVPQGAALSRFAMKTDHGWQEGEIVELASARRVYEDFLHRKQDPALLEQAAGSEFSARVFPIPAHGIKELVVAYSQEIDSGGNYQLPLRGLPELDTMEVSISRAGSRTPELAFHKEHTTPDDLELAGTPPSEGLRADDLVLMRVRPVLADVAPRSPSSVVVLVDTSASRALGFSDELDTVERVIQTIAGATDHGKVAVAGFDQDVGLIYEGEAKAYGATERGKLEQRRALGASNLVNALGWAKAEAKNGSYERVVLITDGVATAGQTESDDILAAAKALGDVSVTRLDAITVGGIRDDAGLRRLVTSGLKEDGVVADGQLDARSLQLRLTRPTQSNIPIIVQNATWYWPHDLDGVQPGDERTVYAQVGKDAVVKVDVGGQTVTPNLTAASKPLLDRAWASAKVQSLLDDAAAPKADTEALKKQIVDLSIKHRVTSPFTAMLVLESEYDYARFKIDRHALADILSVDGGEITLLHRNVPSDPRGDAPGVVVTDVPSNENKPSEERSAALREASEFGILGALDTSGTDVDGTSTRGNILGEEIGDSFGQGGLGLTGVGEGGGGRSGGIGLGNIGTIGHGAGIGTGQGFGNGHGRLGGSHSARSPSLRQGTVSTSGALDAAVIARIVRQNFGRFRLCYESGLTRNPALEGRVSVQFTITATGTVKGSSDAGSSLSDSGVVACVVHGFDALTFPSSASDANVVFPINFTPGESSGGSMGGGERPAAANPYSGKFQTVMDSLAAKDLPAAKKTADDWHANDPGDVLALVALGEVAEASKDNALAARAYGSIIDLFSSRADQRRFAGERLDRLDNATARELSTDTYEKALLQRPDHPSSHRLLAYAYVKNGNYEKAFSVAVAASNKTFADRYIGVPRILKEDVGLIGAAWIKSAPERRDEILGKITAAGAKVEDKPSLRFVLNWETDANDVDFHIYDAKGNHAYYQSKHLASGGELYADITTGYGPECFTIAGARASRAAPYKLQANYYSRGPMGYGMGKLQIIDHDGSGKLTIEDRPYVVMADHAFVDLGKAQ